MSDIQTPNGLEANETLVGATDEIEVYQPASGGIRRNKRAFLDTLKTFFQIITGGVLNNIVTFGGSSNIQDSGVAVADIGSNTTHRGSDGSDHDFLDQDVKSTATPVYTGLDLKGVAADQDRNIKFASDANLDWDESDDVFRVDKRTIRPVQSQTFTAGTTLGTWFSAFDLSIPNTGDKILLSGGGATAIQINTYFLAERTNATTITISGYIFTGGGATSIVAVSGSGTGGPGLDIRLAW